MTGRTATRIGVVGATGAVGAVTLDLLRERGYANVRAFASARSAGKPAGEVAVEEATPETLSSGELDLCFFSVGTSASRELVPHAVRGGAIAVDKSAAYRLQEGVPLVVIAGQEYGTGSSRDWAAKGTKLLGVRAVIAQSFERIHRSNLIGMGVLALQFEEGASAATLGLDGSETFDITGIAGVLRPRQKATLVVKRKDGESENVPVTVRIDTPIEVDYYVHGGILPFVLRHLIASMN